MYEGEVTELTPEEAENPLGGYGKTIANVVIGLKTTKGTKQLKLDPSIYEAIQKEKISTGVSGTDPDPLRATEPQLGTTASNFDVFVLSLAGRDLH